MPSNKSVNFAPVPADYKRMNVYPLFRVILFTTVLFLFPSVSGQAYISAFTETATIRTDDRRSRNRIFPDMLFANAVESVRRAEEAAPFWVRTRAEQEEYIRAMADNNVSILLNNDILVYYGHPLSRRMGILGRYPKPELLRRLSIRAEEYRIAGGRNIIKAFYIIFGTVWPEGEIGIINQNVLREWVHFTYENNMLLFIDHQMGRFDPIDSLRQMFPWLHYPHVHLALDPEWRTNRPMVYIGHLTAAEINRAQQVMQDYLIANNLPGERMLVIHQFDWRMIRNRDAVDATFERVRLVHAISGIGSPDCKRRTYEVHAARATNIPVKGFKLWYPCPFGTPYDYPRMTPEEVFALVPRPSIIIYQ